MTAHTRMTTSLADPVRPGCKCCGRESRHADDCLIPENAQLRARIAELEAELARYDCSAADARICKQQMIEQRARAEKAEAEYNAAYQTVLHLSEALGEAQGEADALRAERDRYRDAIVRLMKGPLVQDMFDGCDALRRIAEEGK